MYIKFPNKNLEYLTCVETEERYNGASRRTLTFECMPDVISVDERNSILSDETNTAEITLVNEEENVTNIYSDYVLKLKCGIESKLTKAETADSAAVYEDRLIFKMGRRTFIEEQLKRLGL